MLADEVLPPETYETDHDAWLAIRATGVGASEVSPILGVNDYECARDVWERKLGRGKPVEVSEAMHWGNVLEPAVRGEFSRRTGIAVTKPGTFRSREFPWMFANPDGLTDDGGGYEGKTCSQWLSSDWDDDLIPDHAELQSQYCMAVLGLPHWYVCGLIGGQRMVWRKLLRDDRLITMITDAVDEFWNVHVQLQIPPKLGAGKAAQKWVTDKHRVAEPGKVVEVDPWVASALRAELVEAKTAKTGGAKLYEAVQNRYRDIMGDAEELRVGGSDKPLATWNHTAGFDEARFALEEPQLYEEFCVQVPSFDRERFAAAKPELYRNYRARRLLIK